MRISLLLPTTLLLLLPCVIAGAQTVEVGKDLTLSAGVFLLGDPEYRQNLGPAVGFTIDKRIRRNKGSELSVRAGWFRASESQAGWYAGESANNELDIVPVSLVKRYGHAYSSQSGTGSYHGYGAGFSVTRLRVNGTYYSEWTEEYYDYSFSEDNVRLTFTALTGWRFSKSAFAEIDLCMSGEESSGIIASIGARF
ncbi:MAG: hypothetical protein Q7T82_15830 [Armatimonadota bacterium]|nr:hypothetical protein [Armatimonadota bacterium]